MPGSTQSTQVRGCKRQSWDTGGAGGVDEQSRHVFRKYGCSFYSRMCDVQHGLELAFEVFLFLILFLLGIAGH